MSAVQLGWAIRKSAYFDSVALMRVSEQARGIPGVLDVAVVMGTSANRAMLLESGLWAAEAPESAPDDLLIAVRAKSDDAVRLALGRVRELLDAPRRAGPSAHEDVVPRTIVSAARRAGSPNLALISVPGPYAAIEAHQALSTGLHVFVFSDGVTLADEVALKRRARDRGLLLMGPECGTAIVNGVGLGFANRVRRGPLGVVGASGTGIQELTTLVHRFGSGISHALGTGGRDLDAAVGGITTLKGLEWLAGDDGTRVIVIVSKPSSREVGDVVLAAAAKMRKPAVGCLLGYDGAIPKGIEAFPTLEEAAVAAVRLAGGEAHQLDRSQVGPKAGAPGVILGLYSGGTLCAEAQRLVGGRNRFVDFGAEEFTRGRPHPIIDPSRRNAAILDAAGEPDVSVLLLDVILGDCAHPDPAGALAPVLSDARDRARLSGRELAIVAHVVGTEQDPQGLGDQENALSKLGVIVCSSNRVAALTARAIAGDPRAG
ncbi:MAG: hypothetical protein DMD91_08135 [Candidatus Rokuibacteriota bacterium]|nr:MAG: hypothetical protein DMD91_08135 [Candidatus Rokubacteria bacterium]